MAEGKTTRSHASGFVKRFRETKNQRTTAFAIQKQQFVLPSDSTFAMVIRMANLRKWPVLVLFEFGDKKHPRITGVIELPEWKQVKAASEGAGYDEVRALRPGGKVLN